MASCAVCKTPTTALCLCQLHSDYLADGLAEIGGMLADLDVTIAKLDRLHPVSGQSELSTRSMINLGAASLRSTVEKTLSTWVRSVAETQKIRFNTMPTAENHADWLIRNIDAVVGREDAGKFYMKVVEWTGDRDKPTKPGKLLSVIDRHHRLYAGTCHTVVGTDHEGLGVLCGLDLWADEDQVETTCPRCHQDIHVQSNRELAIRERDLLPEKRIFEVSRDIDEAVYSDDVQRWLRQGRLHPSGYLHGDRIMPSKQSSRDARLFSLTAVRRLRHQDRVAS